MAPLRDAVRRRAIVTACGGGPAAEKTADLILETERKFNGATSPPPPSVQAQSNKKSDIIL
jgi:hypothetical protein